MEANVDACLYPKHRRFAESGIHSMLDAGRIVTGNISAQGAISGGALFDLIKKMNRIELYQGTPVSNVPSLSALVQHKEKTP